MIRNHVVCDMPHVTCFRSVKHYAGAVEYLIDGFLDKNNDALHADLTNLMKGSSVEFFNSLFKKGLQSQDDTSVGAAAGAPGRPPRSRPARPSPPPRTTGAARRPRSPEGDLGY